MCAPSLLHSRVLRQVCLTLLVALAPLVGASSAFAVADEIVFVLSESDRVTSEVFSAQRDFVDQALDGLGASSTEFNVGVGAYSDVHREITPNLESLATNRAAIDAAVIGIVQSSNNASFPGLAAKKAKFMFEDGAAQRSIVLFTSGHAHGVGFFASHQNNIDEIANTFGEGINVYIIATPSEGGFLSDVGLPAYAAAGGGHDIFGLDEGAQFASALAGTPEPSTVLLCMSGLLAMAIGRRR